MKILFLSNFFPPLHIGGYEELCAEVAENLRKRDHDVRILTTNHRISEQPALEKDIERTLYPEVSLEPFRAVGDFFFMRRRTFNANIQTLNTLLTSWQPDVIVAWGMWNLDRRLLHFLESPGSPPLVYYIADVWPTLPDAYTLYWKEPGRNRATALVKTFLGKVAVSQIQREQPAPALRFDNAACVSNSIRETLCHAGILPENAITLYNGIDLTPFQTEARKKTAHRKQLSLVYAGRVTADKGVLTAIKALGILREKGIQADLTIIGSGTAEFLDECKQMTVSLGVSEQVVFLPKVPREHMPETLNRFDVLIFPSIAPEGLARIVQEAMACQLLVIGTTVGGMAEILVDGKNGLVFPPGDAEALADRIALAARDATLRQQLTTHALETVQQKFDIRHMVDQFENMLQNRVNATAKPITAESKREESK